MRHLLWLGLLAACTASTPQPPPPSSSTVNDLELARNVSLALDGAGISGSEFIRIVAKDGVVTLGGTVPTTQAGARAIDVARGVAGVREVVSELSVKP